jgi:hypothetical protein
VIQTARHSNEEFPITGTALVRRRSASTEEKRNRLERCTRGTIPVETPFAMRSRNRVIRH